MRTTLLAIFCGLLFCCKSGAEITILIVAEGDSITAGNGTTGGSNWVNQLGYLMNNTNIATTNIALSGDTISNNFGATDTLTRLSASANRKIAINALGSNDVGNGYAVPGIQTNFLQWIANVRSNTPSAYIVMTTMMYRVGDIEANRTNLNNWIISNAPVNLVVDIASDSRLQTAPDAPYFADSVHPSNTGAWVVASNIWYRMYSANVLNTFEPTVRSRGITIR